MFDRTFSKRKKENFLTPFVCTRHGPRRQSFGLVLHVNINIADET